MKKQKTTVKQFKEELIASIQNEKRHFDMASFTTMDYDYEATYPANCKTASCMAGHIEALRPRLAKKLSKEIFPEGEIQHDWLAAEIWKQETGQKCRLDFFARNAEPTIFQITREEAVAHIKGRSKKWPLL